MRCKEGKHMAFHITHHEAKFLFVFQKKKKKIQTLKIKRPEKTSLATDDISGFCFPAYESVEKEKMGDYMVSH